MRGLYSWARFSSRTLAAATGIEGRPTKLIFVVTKRCHSRCEYCDIWKLKDTPGALDNELTLDEVRSIARSNSFLQWIDFTGGEPTDRPDFAEVIEAFSEACPDLLLVHFPTNGIATKRIAGMVERLSKSVRARLVVTVSIDGPPEINDRLRGIRNDFAHAVATFAAIRRLIGEDNVFVGMTLHGHTASCGHSTSALTEDTFAAVNQALLALNEAPINWGAFHVNIPHLSQHYYGNAASEAKDGFGGPEHRAEITTALRTVAEHSKGCGGVTMRAVEHVYRAEALRYLSTGRTSVRCSALLSTSYLSEKGEVYPCTIWDKPLGNVRSTGYALMPIIASARRAGVRKAVAEGKCPNCWTPCEAYPAIAASPARALRALVSSA